MASIVETDPAAQGEALVRARPVRWEDQQRWWEEYERANPSAEKLRAHLSFMVPLRIMELRARGCPAADDYERVRSYVSHPGLFWGEGATWGEDEADGNTNTLLCHGTEALLFPRDFPKEYAREWRRKLVDAVAILAFAPGGVRLFGLSFQCASACVDFVWTATSG